MRKDTAIALAEFAHYLQFVDILMTAIGVTAFIIMAGSAHPMEARRIKIQSTAYRRQRRSLGEARRERGFR
jgi:hypothetical protein